MVALANGTAMGGGVGLLAVCDYVVMKHSAMVALSEVCAAASSPARLRTPVAAQRGTAVHGPGLVLAPHLGASVFLFLRQCDTRLLVPR